uniref:Actin-related protein 10 n=1 Tax=Timema douglasi TaxID=61478 RepID=A0A7R8VUL9_TIMDO|nr:unnamed protein product [Timema douglasi]
MPYYEPLGLITEKHPIIIDIGSAYTKVGFAGESGPRAIVKTEVKNPDSKLCQKISDYANEEQLYDFLVDFFHNICFSPKDRRVVIVESLLCPTLFRETLAKALFQHFEVTSVLFTPSHLVTLCTLGVNTALVLDVGYQEAVLIPVYEVRTCFVTSLERAKKAEGNAPPPPPDVSYSVGGLPSFNIPGRIREQAFDVLFQQDGDGNSIPTMILDSILKCSIDMRRPLAENILLIGGTAMAPGFKARLLAELKHLVLTSKYSSKIALQTFKFHTPPAKENYVAWLGGAIFGGTDILAARSLTKEVYMKTNEVPDWAIKVCDENGGCPRKLYRTKRMVEDHGQDGWNRCTSMWRIKQNKKLGESDGNRRGCAKQPVETSGVGGGNLI